MIRKKIKAGHPQKLKKRRIHSRHGNAHDIPKGFQNVGNLLNENPNEAMRMSAALMPMQPASQR
jgi:hypothetical protein